MTGTNQVKEHGVLQGRLGRWIESTVLKMFVCAL